MTNEITKTNGNTDKVAKYDDKQIQLIHDLYAKNTTKEEFELFMYTAGKFGLDPLLKQIWCVKFEKKENGKHIGWERAQIYAGRDGFIEIAHTRGNGQFNGMKSGMKDDKTAYCEVWRKDMDNSFYVEVTMSEYSTGQALWKSKPKTMLIKVAESQALRKAFSISGIYSPEEMGQWELEAQGIKFNTEQPKAIVTTSNQTNDFDWSKLDLNKPPKWEYSKDKKPLAPPIVKRLFAISNKYNIPPDEFKTICKNVTDKEHSYQWTYGNIKEIEETINTIHDQDNKEVEDIIAEPVKGNEEVEAKLIEQFEMELDK